MSKLYGLMIGCKDAIRFVEDLQCDDTETKSRVLNRMRYEFDKDIPTPVKVYRMRSYGNQYVCGNCGTFGIEVHYKYCPNCGFSIDWKNKVKY